jgi:hypothetical protein
MQKLYGLFLAIAVILGFSVALKAADLNNIKPFDGQVRKILWEKPFTKKGLTIIAGSANAEFGKFNFKCVIDDEGKAKLITEESAGSGELPARERKLFLLVYNNKKTILFHEWFSLLNQKKPAFIRPIVMVSTDEFFSVLPKSKLPPVFDVNQKIQSIVWNGAYSTNNIQYLPSTLSTSSGKINICWTKKGDQLPELIQKDDSSENKIYLLMDGDAKTTFLFQEDSLRLKEGEVPYLKLISKVSTTNLLSGFDELNQ